MNMERRFCCLVGLFTVIFLVSCSAFGQKENTKSEYAAGEILVKFKDGVSRQEIDAINKGLDVKVIKFFHHSGVYHLRLPADLEVEEAVKTYTQNPKVEYAEPNYIVSIDSPQMTH